MKYSIIIPTYNHCDDYLKPCVESILKYSNVEDIELIISANGCTDNTAEYLTELKSRLPSKHLRTIFSQKATGYAKANNVAIKIATCDKIVLLNNDTVLLEQKQNEWLELLEQPFKENSTCGISGPLKGFNHDIGKHFMIFFCVMIDRKVFDKIGLLSEDYGDGAGEDTEFCIEAEKAGFTLHECGTHSPNAETNVGSFPIYHVAEGTVHDKTLVKDWDTTFKNNSNLLIKKYGKTNKVLAYVSTRGRTHTTLPLTIAAILNQTKKPDKFVIFDDNDTKEDLRENLIYVNLLVALTKKGIDWVVFYGQAKGQHFNHESANSNSEFTWCWRVDDDCIPEPTTLERLYNFATTTPNVGAVGGSVITPAWNLPEGAKENCSGNILEIFRNNYQWFEIDQVREVDHLHCSFLYRANTAHYNLNLSRAAHREETLFTYELKKLGYQNYIIPNANSIHLKYNTGGIRDVDREGYEADEMIFRKSINYGKIFYLLNGMGDHIVFASLLDEIIAKHGRITLACCYPWVFEDWMDKVTLVPVTEGEKLINPNEHNLYKMMHDNNWQGTIVEAYRKLYNL